jgi:hypothetical protein
VRPLAVTGLLPDRHPQRQTGTLAPSARHGRASLLAGTRGPPVVRDQRTGTLRRVSVSSSGAQADGSSLDADLSADGRFVSFLSDATNLVPHDTYDAQDVFLRGPGPVS